jgi:hypothetical protein
LELALKKQRLEFRSAMLREAIAQDAQALQPHFFYADKFLAGIAWLRRYPLVTVTALAALVIVRPRGMLRWARRALFIGMALRRLRSNADGQVLGKVLGKTVGWR